MDKDPKEKRPGKSPLTQPGMAGMRLARTDAIVVLKTRRSVRTFKPDSVDESILRDIVDCGRLAATANNLQPWEFVVVRDPERRRGLAGLTDHGKFIADAPVCVAVFCKDCKYYLEDGCAAIENILLAARAHDLGTCWVAGDKKPYCPDVARLLNVPDSFRLVGLVAVGYPDKTPAAPAKRSLDEIIHWETF